MFTGAMAPLKNGKDTDGFDNLQDALEVAAHNAKPGVCIVMHRQVFDPQLTDKDWDKGAFAQR